MSSAATRLAGLPFAALAAVRGGRPFHPQGVVARGTLRIDREEPLVDGCAVLRRGTEQPAMIRLSRGVGLPQALPDIYGVALRIRDAGGPALDQDLLFNTSVDAPILHHLLLPVPGWFWTSYTTSLPYRAPGGGEHFLIGLLPPPERVGPADDDLRALLRERPINFGVAVATLEGRWRRIGGLAVEEELPGADLSFNPWNDHGGAIPSGVLQRWRRSAYRESQRVRDAA